MGLSCALGQGVPECAAALSRGEINMVDISLDGFSEPVAMPYYRIPDRGGLFDPDRFYRLIPNVALEAVLDARLSPREIEDMPIFVGSSSFTVRISEALYAAKLAKMPESSLALPWVDFQHIATTVQGSLGCQGDSYAFNTACTSAANALVMAARMLQSSRHRHALVLGVELANQTTLAGFSGLQLVSKAIRPFDLHRTGIILGESVSAVVLSLDEGRHGLSLLGGTIQCDTYSVTTANIDGSTISALQSDLLKQLDLPAASVRAIKAHATSSPSNDAGEAAGMAKAFASLPPVCALKPYTGHTLGACGTVEFILMAEALKAGYLPATPGFETLDPALGVTPTLERSQAGPGYYLLNYFGFGGNNTSLMIEKHP
jgi:3-oxoacyl-[acyl-carrier-protein] synthase-1